MKKTLKIAGLLTAVACISQFASMAVQADPTLIRSPTVTGRSLVGVPYKVVSVADLNLASTAGIQTLHHRIGAAARSVCPSADTRQLREIQASRECRVTAYADAMAQVDTVVGQLRVAAR